MSFASDYANATDPAFQNRVQIAVVKAAANVAGEAQGAMGQVKWIKRHTLAVAVLAAPETYVQKFSFGVVREGLVTPASTDADIEFTVASLWDDFAGVMDGE